MAAILLLLLIIAFSNFIIPRGANRFRGIILAVFQLVAFVFFYQKLAVTNAGEVITESYRWIPELGLNLQFQLDGVSIIFALLVTGIGVLVFLYAQAYMKPYGHLQRFFFFLFLFSFAMLGLVLSANMIQLFIFWELTSFLPFFLITYFNEKEEARAAAFRSLFITAFGGLSLLAGPLSSRTASHSAGSIHQVGTVPVSFLASRSDAGSNAGKFIPALCNNGKSRSIPVDATQPGDGKYP